MDDGGDVRYESWFERQGNALKGMCCGFLTVLLTTYIVFWNEMNLVLSQATADIIMKATEVGAPNAAYDGKLIFTSGVLTAPDIADHFPDPVQPFVNQFEGAEISWNVQIYQWQEDSSESCTKTKDGGKRCTTTYSYREGWTTQPIDSGSFRHPYGHDNVGSLPDNLQDGSYEVEPYSITLGQKKGQEPAYVLDAKMQRQIPGTTVPLHSPAGGIEHDFWQNGGELTAGMLHNSGGYLTTSRGSAEIGDVRVSIAGRMTQTASMVGKQESLDGVSTSVNNPEEDVTTENYPPEVFDMWGRKTYAFEYLRDGIMSKEDFMARIKAENSFLAWIVRISCFIAMVAAFNCIFGPLSVAADLLKLLDYVTCCLGSILDSATQFIIGAVSFASACFCFTSVFTVAWLYANPTVAVFGLLIIGALVAAGCYAGQKFRESKGKTADARMVAVQDYVKLAGEDQQEYLVVV